MPWKVSLAVFLPMCALSAQPQPGERTYNVNELIQTATDRNREVLALRQGVAEARGLLRQAGARPAPSLQFEAATGSPFGSPGKEEYAAGYSQPLETGGKRDKRIQAAEIGVRRAEAEVAERINRLATDIKLRYTDVIADQARLQAFGRLIESYRQSLHLLDARVQQGDAAPLDRQLLAVEVSRVEAQKRTVEGRLLVALSDLRRLCGFRAAEPLGLSTDRRAEAPTLTLDDLQKQALEQRPDLRASRLDEQRSEAEVTLAEARGRPDLTLSAQYALRNERMGNLYGLTPAGQLAPIQDRDSIISFGLNIPILTRRKNQGNIEAAVARASGSRTLREHLEATIPIEVQAAWQHWDAATQSLRILDAGVVNQSEKNLEVMRQAYELGQLRLLDVLNEQRHLIDTRMAFIDSETEVSRALIELERAVGGDLK
jgi:outer membrane protein, heavy metal efflux system